LFEAEQEICQDCHAVKPTSGLGSQGGCPGPEFLRETVGRGIDVQSNSDDDRRGSVGGGGLLAEDAAYFLVADQ